MPILFFTPHLKWAGYPFLAGFLSFSMLGSYHSLWPSDLATSKARGLSHIELGARNLVGHDSILIAGQELESYDLLPRTLIPELSHYPLSSPSSSPHVPSTPAPFHYPTILKMTCGSYGFHFSSPATRNSVPVVLETFCQPLSSVRLQRVNRKQTNPTRESNSVRANRTGTPSIKPAKMRSDGLAGIANAALDQMIWIWFHVWATVFPFPLIGFGSRC